MCADFAARFDATPDTPLSFGYKIQWYAIRTADTAEVAEAFQLDQPQPANWQTGLTAAFQGYYFISPPLAGWTLAVNAFMPDLGAAGADNPLETIKRLSSRFGEACYFGSHRVVDYYAWAKAVNGELIRAYSYVGESDEVLVDEGAPTAEERDNGLIFAGADDEYEYVDEYDDNNDDTDAGEDDSGDGADGEEEYDEESYVYVPCEDDVISIAGLWTISPFLEDEDYERGTGIAGLPKRQNNG